MSGNRKVFRVISPVLGSYGGVISFSSTYSRWFARLACGEQDGNVDQRRETVQSK